MLYWIWQKLQLLLPFGFILYIYKRNKAIPANIKTRHGRNLKAIMISTDYGILVSEEAYVKNRTLLLKKKQQKVSQLNDELMAEINSLSFEEREYMYNREHDDQTI